METALQERSHVSPFCIHTVSARATLRPGGKAPLSGLSQNVLLNNVGVLSPWEVGKAQPGDWPARQHTWLWDGDCHRAERPPGSPEQRAVPGGPDFPGQAARAGAAAATLQSRVRRLALPGPWPTRRSGPGVALS